MRARACPAHAVLSKSPAQMPRVGVSARPAALARNCVPASTAAQPRRRQPGAHRMLPCSSTCASGSRPCSRSVWNAPMSPSFQVCQML